MYKQVNFENIHEIAKEIRAYLKPGVIILLNGPMGVGKTTLIKHILPEYDVSSPSFLHLQYYGEDFAHIDAYMINSINHFLNLEISDILDSRCLIIEWGNLVLEGVNLFDAKIINIDMFFDDEKNRIIKLS